MIPFSMRGLQRLGDLTRDLERVVDREGTALQAIGQRLSLHQFHHQQVTSVILLKIVDDGDVGVVQRGEQLRLALETGDAVRFGRKRVGEAP